MGLKPSPISSLSPLTPHIPPSIPSLHTPSNTSAREDAAGTREPFSHDESILEEGRSRTPCQQPPRVQDLGRARAGLGAELIEGIFSQPMPRSWKRRRLPV